MKNLILAVVIGSVVFMGLACGREKSSEPSQLQQEINQHNAELAKYQ